MIIQLKTKYTVFDNIEAMLAPETLSYLLSKTITRVEVQPMNGHGGLAGGHLSYVNTDAGRLVLKRMSMETDWIMFSSDDRLCRSVTLWQYGLLDRLLPHAEHKIMTCARDGNGWAILMHDLTGSTFTWADPIAPEIVPTFLDLLAHLHATFWDESDLAHPALGLCSPATLLDQSALPMANSHLDFRTSPIPEWVREGWKILPELLEPNLFQPMHDLIENPQPLFEALQRYPRTLLHGDYRIENFAYHAERPILLDWQEASFTLMTTDLAWLVKNGYVHDVMSREQAINYYRTRLERYLGQTFDDADWQAMLDLGCCLDTLRTVGFHAFFYQNAQDSQGKLFNEKLVRQQAEFVRDAMRWF